MPARPSRSVALLAACVAAAACAAWLARPGGAGGPQVVRYRVPSEALRNGPVRLLVLSDVDFPSSRDIWSRIPALARELGIDAVLVAGDLLDRDATVADGAVRREAAAWLAELPAPGRRFLAPGEQESGELDVLRADWPAEVVEPLANEARALEIRGERIDLFVADRRTDPAPWSVARIEDRPAAFSLGRRPASSAAYRPAAARSWSNYEVTVAFVALDDDASVELRLGVEDEGPGRGSCWRLSRHERRPAFRLRAAFPGRPVVTGRTRSGFFPPTGVWCRARVRFEDDGRRARIRARFWPEAAREPADWTIDAVTEGAERRSRGGVAISGRGGRRAFADLRVVSLEDGRMLLAEPFDDPARFARDWEQESALGRWLRAPSGGAARVVLAHHPDVVLDALAAGGLPDLVVAGHTHGGQIRVPGLGPLYVSSRLGARFARGLFRVGGIPIVITSGVGTSILPLRMGVPPEIAVVDLVPLHSSTWKEEP